jgi:L-histidine N-alpha-methyltransferase
LVDENMMAQGLIRDARDGLCGQPKRLPPKYFYDAAGAALFERITQLPEYYLTRAERALLAAHGREIMADLTPQELVELGAGSVAKVRRLLGAAPVGASVLRYVPLDIDAGTIAAAGRELESDYPDLNVHGIVGDFQQHLGHVPGSFGRRLVVFFGSTIGNLDPEPRRQLLDGVRGLLSADDRFLLGLDLVKERRVLEAAYDDRAGVTAAFNRNILRVVNRGLGGDFVPEAFRHHARYDADASRIEMHLVPAQHQTAYLRDVDLTVEVAAGESIWTESSYKFTRETVEAMLIASGLGLDRWYSDGQFSLALAAPRG